MNLSRTTEDRVREEIFDMLQDYVCSSTTLGFCNTCPELRYHEDIGCYDCPAGLSVDSCEYCPTDELNRLSSKVAEAFENARP